MQQKLSEFEKAPQNNDNFVDVQGEAVQQLLHAPPCCLLVFASVKYLPLAGQMSGALSIIPASPGSTRSFAQAGSEEVAEFNTLPSRPGYPPQICTPFNDFLRLGGSIMPSAQETPTSRIRTRESRSIQHVFGQVLQSNVSAVDRVSEV